VEEFTFLGDASVKRPTSNDPATMDQWFDYVYLRDNPKGRFDEYVHHSGGCRAWLVVSRNTQTHEVYGCMSVRDYTKKNGGKA
jgi:heterotetrameric sarcosine oxidase delta subunit